MRLRARNLRSAAASVTAIIAQEWDRRARENALRYIDSGQTVCKEREFVKRSNDSVSVATDGGRWSSVRLPVKVDGLGYSKGVRQNTSSGKSKRGAQTYVQSSTKSARTGRNRLSPQARCRRPGRYHEHAASTGGPATGPRGVGRGSDRLPGSRALRAASRAAAPPWVP